MGERTGISWTDATWNPWQGCHKVSPGCKLCYMFREKLSYGQEPNIVVRSTPHTFNLPLRLKSPARVFTCSWSDFFIEEADPWRAEAWALIERTPHLTYQILTKRVERVATHLPWGPRDVPWPHVQLIVSVESQEYADARIPMLLGLNAAVRGVSYEPALGPVDFARWMRGLHPPDVEWDDPSLDWLIVGGESGPGARPMHPAWARAARDQCQAAGVAYFFKQWGEHAPVPKRPGGVGCMVRAGDIIVTPDGRQAPIETDLSCHLEGQGTPMRRVGKKAAGALLDGREWREFPAAPALGGAKGG